MSAPRKFAIFAMAIAALAACSDRVPSTAPENPPPIEPPALARIIATVDAKSGTMTFDPVPSARRSVRNDISAAIYGDQGLTVRIYNTPVTVTPVGGGRKQYSGDVGIQNLLDHSIGDEQAGPASHNLGIYVFVTNGPTVTTTSSPCSPACTVNVVGQHGIRQFTAAGQPYWYWGEQLAAAGQPGDTTTNRVTWTFEADTQVTGFQFEVLVSAAWPAPEETRWAVVYGGDSLPNAESEPRWFRNNLAGNVTTIENQPQSGMIRVIASQGASLIYLRTDSVTSTMDAYVEARIQVQSVQPLTAPEISFGLDDRTKFIGVGLSSTQAGFLSGALTLISGGSAVINTTQFHTYQLRKYAADSVALYIDGVRRAGLTYAALPAPIASSNSFGFYFGPLGSGPSANSFQGNTSNWDYVIYEMGATQP